MIQFNLLPDVKIQFIKAQRMRQLVLTISILVGTASLAVLLLLLSYDGLQKKHLSDLNKDIGSEITSLKSQKGISTVLTVQNQLGSLSTLHKAKPAAGRLLDYLNQLTPASDSIQTINIDFNQLTLSISGKGVNLASVTQFADTLKLTSYTTPQVPSKLPAFNNVVLSSFSLGKTDKSGSTASFTLSVNFDKTIFDNSQEVTLSVPNTITRSQLQSPSDIFTATGGN